MPVVASNIQRMDSETFEDSATWITSL